jgi:RNA recognition motif-containing protein
MSIVPGVLRSKVFIGCVPASVEEGEIRSTLQNYGKLLGFFYCRDGMNSDRGFAFATFSNDSEALKCVSGMNGSIVFENSSRPVHAKLSCEKLVDTRGTVFEEPTKPLPSTLWEEYTSDEGYPYYYNRETGETVWEKPKFFTPPVPEPAAMPQPVAGTVGYIQNSGYGPLGANLFIFHVPAEWKDEDLKTRFEPFGQLVSCKVSLDDAGRSRGFGFVGFTTRESAANAVQAMNGSPCGPGKFLKVNIKQGEEEYAVPPTVQPSAQTVFQQPVTVQHVYGAGPTFR